MSAATATRIECPTCKAILMSRRKSCRNCGEPIPESVLNFSTPDYYGFRLEELRKLTRKRASIPAVVVGREGSAGYEVLVENICETGLLFRSNHPHAVGERFQLALTLGGLDYVVPGTVRRLTRTLEVSQTFAVGFEFLNPSTDLRREISQLPEAPGH